MNAILWRVDVSCILKILLTSHVRCVYLWSCVGKLQMDLYVDRNWQILQVCWLGGWGFPSCFQEGKDPPASSLVSRVLKYISSVKNERRFHLPVFIHVADMSHESKAPYFSSDCNKWNDTCKALYTRGAWKGSLQVLCQNFFVKCAHDLFVTTDKIFVDLSSEGYENAAINLVKVSPMRGCWNFWNASLYNTFVKEEFSDINVKLVSVYKFNLPWLRCFTEYGEVK